MPLYSEMWTHTQTGPATMPVIKIVPAINFSAADTLYLGGPDITDVLTGITIRLIAGADLTMDLRGIILKCVRVELE